MQNLDLDFLSVIHLLSSFFKVDFIRVVFALLKEAIRDVLLF